jgi:hypothetical protein
MSDSGSEFTAGLGIGMLMSSIGFTLLLAITDGKPAYHWHQEAIKHNAGQYHPVTGKFEWKE